MKTVVSSSDQWKITVLCKDTQVDGPGAPLCPRHPTRRRLGLTWHRRHTQHSSWQPGREFTAWTHIRLQWLCLMNTGEWTVNSGSQCVTGPQLNPVRMKVPKKKTLWFVPRRFLLVSVLHLVCTSPPWLSQSVVQVRPLPPSTPPSPLVRSCGAVCVTAGQGAVELQEVIDPQIPQ